MLNTFYTSLYSKKVEHLDSIFAHFSEFYTADYFGRTGVLTGTVG